MALKTRKPTGIVPWPMVLVEGPEKSGKTWMALLLSTSKKVGRTILVELGPEGIADQYGTIPGADYEIAEHNGTFEGLSKVIQDATDEAKAVIAADEPPMVLVIDTASEEWDLLKAMAEQRAKLAVARAVAAQRQAGHDDVGRRHAGGVDHGRPFQRPLRRRHPGRK